MALQWAHCPVCGTGHSTLDPTAPCSAQCRGRQSQARALGKPAPSAEPKYGRPDDRRGKAKGPGPVPKAKPKGMCSIALLPPAVGVAALVVALVRSRH